MASNMLEELAIVNVFGDTCPVIYGSTAGYQEYLVNHFFKTNRDQATRACKTWLKEKENEKTSLRVD